jgi:hypothetical protein
MRSSFHGYAYYFMCIIGTLSRVESSKNQKGTTFRWELFATAGVTETHFGTRVDDLGNLTNPRTARLSSMSV